jgi:hypothetical protein
VESVGDCVAGEDSWALRQAKGERTSLLQTSAESKPAPQLIQVASRATSQRVVTFLGCVQKRKPS